MADGNPHVEGAPRDGVYVLRGLLVCGLVVTAGSGQSSLHEIIRAALPLLAGLGFGAALGETRSTGRGFALRWTLHLTAMWLVTLSPVMWGSREVARTCAVAGILVVSLRTDHSVRRAWIAAGVVIAVTTLMSLQPAWLPLGPRDLGYALGVAWPRGWLAVGRDATLFLLGYWAAGGQGIRRIAGWHGITEGLRALGRMPLTTALGQSLLAWALFRAGRPDRGISWLHPALVDSVLMAQLVFSWWWLRTRQSGPCEYVLGRARASLGSLRAAASTMVSSPRSS